LHVTIIRGQRMLIVFTTKGNAISLLGTNFAPQVGRFLNILFARV
jgi:hypothetical protein